MADATEQQEKTEAATPRRLEKAREEGQVARSRELTTFTMLLAGVLSLWVMGRYLYAELRGIMESAFLFGNAEATEPARMLSGTAVLLNQGLIALLPLFLFMIVVSLVSPMLLGGFLISGKSLVPELSKLNPIKGLKRIFSAQALVELAKVLAKILLLGAVASLYITARHEEFLSLMHLSLPSALAGMLTLCVQICAVMVLSMMVVILIDVPFQLWNHAKQLRMSKEEVRREHKEAEGDPQIKSKIRSLQQAMARRRMMSRVPTADVIITNPTHYAVALKYEENAMSAPRVVAKGTDTVAQRIRELGLQHSVPVLEAPPLARTLYRHVDLEREIPYALFSVVAEVLAWAVSLKRGSGLADRRFPKPCNLDIPEALQVN